MKRSNKTISLHQLRKRPCTTTLKTNKELSDEAASSQRFVRVAFPPRSSDTKKKHQCPGLNWVANAASSLALCEQMFFVLLFCVRAMSWNIDMDMTLSHQKILDCARSVTSESNFLMSRVEAKFNFRKIPRSFHWTDLDSRLQHIMWNLKIREHSS